MSADQSAKKQMDGDLFPIPPADQMAVTWKGTGSPFPSDHPIENSGLYPWPLCIIERTRTFHLPAQWGPAERFPAKQADPFGRILLRLKGALEKYLPLKWGCPALQGLKAHRGYWNRYHYSPYTPLWLALALPSPPPRNSDLLGVSCTIWRY